jgi:tetratricopeptide (TPR) repeat protein
MKRPYRIGLILLGFMALGGPALAQNDHYPQYMQMASTAYEKKHYDLAIEYYNSAIDDNSDYWQAYVGLGNCYYWKKNFKKALECYEKALKMNPDNPTLEKFLRALRFKMGILPTPTPTPLMAAPLPSTGGLPPPPPLLPPK